MGGYKGGDGLIPDDAVCVKSSNNPVQDKTRHVSICLPTSCLIEA